MITSKQKEQLKEILECNGEFIEVVCCMEEMSELTKELSKALRSRGDADEYIETRGIKEEIADVYVMLEQIKNIFEIYDSEIIYIMRQKIDREYFRCLNL